MKIIKEDIEQNELYMPSGLKMEKEYFPGFGNGELIPTAISLCVLLIIDCVLYIAGVRNMGVFFFIPLIGTSAVAMIHIKGEMNLSPVDMIKLEIRFLKSQKYYPYVAADEWDIDF